MIGTLQKIYRIQNDKGLGPYCDMDINTGLLNNHSGDAITYPLPRQEPAIAREMYTKEYCGFLSLDALHNWFSKEEIEDLAILGYHIIEVFGIVTAIGKKQILFMKEGACSRHYILNLPKLINAVKS